MPILALDTSAAVAVAVLDDDGQVLAAHEVAQERRHAELLAPLIQQVLTESGVGVSDLAHVVVGTGPAPFTGLRVGLVTAQTFAFAAGVPVFGVSGLDAIAEQATDALDLPVGTTLVVVTDAKRREVFWASYEVTDIGAELTSGPGVDKPMHLVELVAGAVVVGSGADLFTDVLEPAADLIAGRDLTPSPAVLSRLARRRLDQGIDLPTEPLYLRRPDAQEPGARKRATR